jgi:hypothetical protein
MATSPCFLYKDFISCLFRKCQYPRAERDCVNSVHTCRAQIWCACAKSSCSFATYHKCSCVQDDEELDLYPSRAKRSRGDVIPYTAADTAAVRPSSPQHHAASTALTQVLIPLGGLEREPGSHGATEPYARRRG